MSRLWMVARTLLIVGIVATLLIGCSMLQGVRLKQGADVNRITSVQPVLTEVYGRIPISNEVYQR